MEDSSKIAPNSNNNDENQSPLSQEEDDTAVNDALETIDSTLNSLKQSPDASSKKTNLPSNDNDSTNNDSDDKDGAPSNDNDSDGNDGAAPKQHAGIMKKQSTVRELTVQKASEAYALAVKPILKCLSLAYGPIAAAVPIFIVFTSIFALLPASEVSNSAIWLALIFISSSLFFLVLSHEIHTEAFEKPHDKKLRFAQDKLWLRKFAISSVYDVVIACATCVAFSVIESLRELHDGYKTLAMISSTIIFR